MENIKSPDLPFRLFPVQSKMIEQCREPFAKDRAVLKSMSIDHGSAVAALALRKLFYGKKAE